MSWHRSRRLWTLIADHRSQIKKVIWRSSIVDPFLLLLSEQTARIRSLERWMARIINVSLALEKRGYPQGIETELHLKVCDSLLTENNGNFILSVSGGRGEITRGGRSDLQLDVGGLASLYTGLFTPHQLQLTDRLQSTDDALNLATLIFAGPQPWLPDFF
ncbi:sterol carrier protein domain-containing protein [Kamptonema sp. UHCC 0994]|nr:sterol carrier protein domain-containing protein [Kamptonema sp. UHCC 0994]